MRTENDMGNITENTTDEEMSAKDACDYDIACGISSALGIAAFAVAWIVGLYIYNLKGYDSLFFGVAAGGMGLFLVGIAFLFVYIFYVAGKGKHYDNIFWIMIWLTQTVGMVMFAAPSIAEKVV